MACASSSASSRSRAASPATSRPKRRASIHEGGELGYSLSHAYGAAFDNPDLLVCAIVGDGEAETGPLATSWHSNKFLDPAGDGAVLPILHLNGYKIANPTVLARIPEEELRDLMIGYGYKPYFVEGDQPAAVHQELAATLDTVLDEIRDIQAAARSGKAKGRPAWPMIVLRTPKGWTGPKELDGKPLEGSWRSHQVPFGEVRTNAEASPDARDLAAQLQARGVVRRHGPAAARAGGPGARGRSAAWAPTRTPTAACSCAS